MACVVVSDGVVCGVGQGDRCWVHSKKRNFRSWSESDRALMGGYTFPILDSFGHYSIESYPLPHSDSDWEQYEQTIGDPKVLFAYVDGNVTVVRAGFGFDEMGLSILTKDGQSGKTVKRAKTLARPFRTSVQTEGLSVKVIEGGPELDGFLVVNRKLFERAVDNTTVPGFHPVQSALLRRKISATPVHNFRAIGRLFDAESGEEMPGFIKGNCAIADLPDGIGIITTRDNIKPEFINANGTRAWACFEPQAPKSAFEDQQTVVNQRFVTSAEKANDVMAEVTEEHFSRLIKGEVLSSTEDLVEKDFPEAFAYSGDNFARVLRWYSSAWAVHGMSYLDSPWMTERLGISFLESFQIGDKPRLDGKPDHTHKKLRVPIPGAKRAQIISASMASLAGFDRKVEFGSSVWVPELGCMVVSDRTWVEIIIPSHGGCDGDDFFVIRPTSWCEDDGFESVVITRSPNSRGEWTELGVQGELWPGAKDTMGIDRSAPRPTQILKALDSGDVKYIPLPSSTLEKEDSGQWRDYDHITDTTDDVTSLVAQSGSYGSFELALRAYFSGQGIEHMPEILASEDAVDAFTQGGSAEDQTFILSQTEVVLSRIIDEAVEVDPLLHQRLPKEFRELIGVNKDGILAQIKRVQVKWAKRYRANLSRFTQSLDIPEYLQVLGDNPHRPGAIAVLKQSRYEMYLADQAGEDAAGRRAAQESRIMPVVERLEGADRHAWVMAFWLASRTVKTSTGRTSDQPVFGTALFSYVLDALVYYGVAKAPQIIEEETQAGTVTRVVASNPVEYLGGGISAATCQGCNETLHIDAKRIHLFHNAGGICKACR